MRRRADRSLPHSYAKLDFTGIFRSSHCSVRGSIREFTNTFQFASSIVGTSGSEGTRVRVVTPSARSSETGAPRVRPVRTNRVADGDDADG